MKFIKLLLISAVLGMCVGLIFDARDAYSAPRDGFMVSKEYTNNGNARQGFMVTCASTTWTAVLPSSVIRRYAIIHTTSTSVAEVCLSTISASATVCAATTDGIHFPYVGVSIEDNNEAPLYCRVIAANGATVNLYGQKQYDTGD
jgi:hypothetical protein